MGRNKEPVAIIKAKGKSHLGKAELEKREEEELVVPFVDVSPPEYLEGKKLRDKFNHYAEMLLKLNIFTELDVDCLARYIMSEQLYIEYTRLLNKLIKSQDYEQMGRIQRLQGVAFGQCQQCARDLGMTITSRCKLVIPKPTNDAEETLW